MLGKTITRVKSTQAQKGFFFKRNPQRQHSFFESAASNKFFGPAETIYRKCDECSKEEKVHRKTNHTTATSHDPANPHTYLNKLDGSGQSLPKDQQQFFGQRMNYDFEEVKIHTDREASDSATSLNAQAYTHKNHVVFNKNKYQPSTIEGRKLLSHELAHVVQQHAHGILNRQHHPQSTPRQPGQLMPVDPVERQRWQERRAQERRARQELLRQELMPFIERHDAPGLLSHLRALNADQAADILMDVDFLNTLQVRFHGVALWSIFSIILILHIPNALHQRLDNAILSGEAQLVVDLLELCRTSPDFYYDRRRLLRIVLPQVFDGHALLREMLSLVQETPPTQIGQVSFETNRVHYERNRQGHMELRHFGGRRTLDYRTTATQMRVVVPLDFVQPNARSVQFYFIGGTLPSILDNWLNTITRVWNNQFYLYNGHQALLLVFAPIAVHAGQHQIEVHTNAGETCTRGSDPGRAQGDCYFTFNTGNTIAHEFGHLIGAGDEYNLPATAAEIPASTRVGMSDEDIRESNVGDINRADGIRNPTLPAVAGGHDLPDSLMSDEQASQHVYARHIRRLVNAINARLSAGVPPYRIGRPASTSV